MFAVLTFVFIVSSAMSVIALVVGRASGGHIEAAAASGGSWWRAGKIALVVTAVSFFGRTVVGICGSWHRLTNRERGGYALLAALVGLLTGAFVWNVCTRM